MTVASRARLQFGAPAVLPTSVRAVAAVLLLAGTVLALLGVAIVLGAPSLPEPFEGVTGGQLIVVALRLAVPLLILRWALLGGGLALVVDALDVVIVEWFGPGGMGPYYAQLDKGLDTYYLALEALVAWYWTNPWARWSALALFAHRLVGVLLFEVLGARVLLFIFPNVFEYWWLYCVIVARWWPRLVPSSWRSVLLPLAVILVPKLGQEYLLHVVEAQPWNWMKEHLPFLN